MLDNGWFTIKEDEQIINKKYIESIKLEIEDKGSEHYGDMIYTMYGYILITTTTNKEFKLNVISEHYSPSYDLVKRGYPFRSVAEKELREQLLPVFKKYKEEICGYMREGE